MKAFIIGITGGSGSGKTTFADKLKLKLKDQTVTFISMDNYYHPREKQDTDVEGIKNFDLPSSLDHEAFYNDLIKLQKGEEIVKQEYTFNDETKDPKIIIVPPAPIIIIEGLFIFHYKIISKLIDLKIFIGAKENLKVIRRIKRDRVERNYPLEDVLYRYQNHVLPSFEKYILPYKSHSDVIINNNNKGFGVGLDLVYGFIKNRLENN